MADSLVCQAAGPYGSSSGLLQMLDKAQDTRYNAAFREQRRAGIYSKYDHLLKCLHVR